jgi:hypothetical protein
MRNGVWAGVLLCFLQCLAPLGGTSTETTNGICVSIVGTTVTGTTTPGVTVALCKTNYNPCMPGGIRPDSMVVGPDGAFTFLTIDTGSYNIIAVTPARDSGLFIPNVTARPGWQISINDTFTAMGVIRGTITPDTSGHRLGTIAYLRGTSFVDTVTAESRFTLRNIPSGSFRIELFMFFDQPIVAGPKSIAGLPTNVSVMPGDTVAWVQP